MKHPAAASLLTNTIVPYGLKVVSLYAKGNLEWHPYVTLNCLFSILTIHFRLFSFYSLLLTRFCLLFSISPVSFLLVSASCCSFSWEGWFHFFLYFTNGKRERGVRSYAWLWQFPFSFVGVILLRDFYDDLCLFFSLEIIIKMNNIKWKLKQKYKKKYLTRHVKRRHVNLKLRLGWQDFKGHDKHNNQVQIFMPVPFLICPFQIYI